ncbi:TPA: AmmeMemoRadiSam system protein A [Candidatus Woesearchaeota archaeon]|nr:AmmeMemoRadiSam system protein A [Candidatus Woesearchaeota archaeon]
MLDEEHKRLLLRLAKSAIIDAVSKRAIEAPRDVPGALQQIGASFVTITKNGELRGHAGTISPHRALYLDVMENARRAAFDDCEFKQLSANELREITIEISVLSTAQERHARSTYDLLDMLRAERPGVILRHGYHQATLLPAAWNDTSGAEGFLSHLCAKAGLPARAWEDKTIGKNITYSTYTVESMKE